MPNSDLGQQISCPDTFERPIGLVLHLPPRARAPSSVAKAGLAAEEMRVGLQADHSKPGKDGCVFVLWWTTFGVDMSASSLFCTAGVKRSP